MPRKFRYADDLVLIVNTQEEYISMLKEINNGMESKGLRVNMKTKFVASGVDLDVLKNTVSLCCLLQGCQLQLQQVLAMQAVGPQEMQQHHWSTNGQPELHLPRCKGECWPISGRTATQVDIESTKRKPLSAIWMTCCAPPGAVTMPLPPDAARPGECSQPQAPLPYGACKVYTACVCSARLQGSPNTSDLQRICCNDCTMIQWICVSKDWDETSLVSLLLKLGI